MVWKTVKPFFCDKGPMRQKITLIEKDEIQGNNKEIQGNNKEISEILHDFSRV